MTPSPAPDEPPFSVPMGLELRHLVDAADEAARLRAESDAFRLGRLFNAASNALDLTNYRGTGLDRLRREVAAQFAAGLDDDAFGWLAERAAERKAAAR